MFCIYLTLGTSGSNVLYTTETYIDSHCTGNNNVAPWSRVPVVYKINRTWDLFIIRTKQKRITRMRFTWKYIHKKKEKKKYYNGVDHKRHRDNEIISCVLAIMKNVGFFLRRCYPKQHKDLKTSDHRKESSLRKHPCVALGL